MNPDLTDCVIEACVINVIAFNKAYCLYPRATLEERVSLICTTRDDDVIENVYDRYRKRGWFIIRTVDEASSLTSDPSLTKDVTRWIDDGFSWSIPLYPPTYLNRFPQTNPCSYDPVSVTSWKLIESRSTTSKAAEMTFVMVSDQNLSQNYVLAGNTILHKPSIIALMGIDNERDAGSGIGSYSRSRR